MKFSVKTLLAFTLLAALTVNGCNTFFQLTALQIENSKLQSRLSNYRSHTVNFEERKLLYERAIEATAVRMRDLNSVGKEQAGRSGENHE
jgi:hypothetical protein